MPAFPSYAILLFNGFAEKPEAGVIRTAKEGGLPKQRKRFSRVLVSRPVRYFLNSKADYNSFRSWHEITIGRVGWFDWIDPRTGTTLQARIAGGQIDPTPNRKDLEKWIVAMTLETWDS